MDYGHWDISLVGDFDPAEFFGFIYEIEQRSTGKAYIGKKFFKFKRQKTKANKSRTKESDWRDYMSSSESLTSLIEEVGRDDFAFRIVRLCTGRCELTYSEQEAQFAADVLRARLPNGDRKYFNKTIGHLLFSGVEKQTEESNRKRSESQKGRPGRIPSAETRQKMSEAHRGTVLTEETRAKMSAAKMGHPVSDEARRNMSESHLGHTHSEDTKAKMSHSQKAAGNKPPVNWGNRNRLTTGS